MTNVHEAYDLFMRLQEAIPADLSNEHEVASALNALDDALTAYDRASEITASDVLDYVYHNMSAARLAACMEIPPARVSMTRPAAGLANGGLEFTITIGRKQFLLTVAPNDGMG